MLKDCWNNTSGYTKDSTWTNQTKEFLNRYEKIRRCIEVNPYPCDKCFDDYKLMNDFYDDMHAEKHEKICFDLQDKVINYIISLSK